MYIWHDTYDCIYIRHMRVIRAYMSQNTYDYIYTIHVITYIHKWHNTYIHKWHDTYICIYHHMCCVYMPWYRWLYIIMYIYTCIHIIMYIYTTLYKMTIYLIIYTRGHAAEWSLQTSHESCFVHHMSHVSYNHMSHVSYNHMSHVSYNHMSHVYDDI